MSGDITSKDKKEWEKFITGKEKLDNKDELSLNKNLKKITKKIDLHGYALEEANKMFYNPSLELYEGLLLLKQGFYNYKYIIKKEDKLFKNGISWSHAQTENEYQILVYYRENGALYDALIGVGKVSSFNLKN